MPLVISLLVFAAVVLSAWAVLKPKPNPVARRIRGDISTAPTNQRRFEGGIGERLLGPAARRFGGILARLLPNRLVNNVEQMLIMANSTMPVTVFLSIWASSVALGVLLSWLMIRSNPNLATGQAFLILVMVVGLFTLIPYMLLRRRVKKRQKSITRALPDALDLLVTGIEAGLGVDAAFAMVTEKTSGPLSQAFSLYLRQVGLGRPRRDAFLDVAQRTGVTDLIRIAASVAQAEQMGAVLGDVLRIQAQDLRVLRRQRAQEAAQRAPVLMTIPMASCFLPAMGAVIIVPSILNLMTFFTRK